MKPGTLYLVATPIGNLADLTLRAGNVLSDCDGVVCEERRVGSTLLAHLKIEKPLYEWNEHSDAEQGTALVNRLVQGESLALISDHGTPLIQDPGAELVNAAIAEGVRVEPIPGASAILAALVASGIAASRFRFLGQLPQKQEARLRALQGWVDTREPMILIDAPYRLGVLLQTAQQVFGDVRRAVVACNLTLPDENFVRGTLGELVAHFTEQPFKGEFVVVIEGKKRNQFAP